MNTGGDERDHRKHHQRQTVNVPVERHPQATESSQFIVRPRRILRYGCCVCMIGMRIVSMICIIGMSMSMLSVATLILIVIAIVFVVIIIIIIFFMLDG